MKKRYLATAIAALTILLAGCQSFNHRTPDWTIHDPDVALRMLLDGNARFVSNNLMPRTTNKQDLEILSVGQWPFAVIITCSDSRVAPEIYFDQKLGDIFVIRNAGNIADSTALGSMEYALEHLGTKLVVVVGHESCGAVHGAFAHGHDAPANLQGILDTVLRNTQESQTAEDAVFENIASVKKTIEADEVVKATGAMVVGAFYEISTGRVTLVD